MNQSYLSVKKPLIMQFPQATLEQFWNHLKSSAKRH